MNKSRDSELDRGTRILVDDLLAKPESWSRAEMLSRARRYRYHSYKSPDAMCSVTMVRHLKNAGFHDLAQNAADGKYDQQRDAGDEWAKTAEGRELMEAAKDPKVRQALDGMVREASRMPRHIVPDDGPDESGSTGQA